MVHTDVLSSAETMLDHTLVCAQKDFVLVWMALSVKVHNILLRCTGRLTGTILLVLISHHCCDNINNMKVFDHIPSS